MRTSPAKIKQIEDFITRNPEAGRGVVSKTFGIPMATVQRILKSLGHKATGSKIPPKQKATFDKASGVASATDDNIRTLDDLLRVCKVDLSVWRVKSHTVNKWEVAGRHNDGFIHAPLFQVKAVLERIPYVADVAALTRFFEKELGKLKAKRFPRPKLVPGRGNLLEISIPNLHIGKMAWHPETGHGHYDTKIAIQAYKSAVAELLAHAPLATVGRILLPLGNDFFNVDNSGETTTGGTPQHEDSRWQASFMAGASLMAETIEELSEVAPVDVVIIQGNHDYERSFYLGEYLRAWFRHHDGVTIDNGPSYRKYYRHGNVLLGFTHGDKEKPTDLPLLMARERPQLWGETKYQEWHLGHLHTEKLREIVGVKVRHLPSLTSADAWHAGKGYVGNIRAAEAFLYDKEKGLVATFLHTNQTVVTD